MKHILMLLMAVGVLAMAGCATKPMTPQEREFQTAQNSCRMQAAEMIGPGFGWDLEGQRSSYFEWCMENMGYTKADLSKIWY